MLSYMLNKTCLKCGKIMEGYTEKHLDTLMLQHEIKHKNELKLAEVENATA